MGNWLLNVTFSKEHLAFLGHVQDMRYIWPVIFRKLPKLYSFSGTAFVYIIFNTNVRLSQLPDLK